MIIYIEVLLIVNLLIHLYTVIIIKEVFYLKLRKTFYLTLIIDLIYMVLYVYDVKIDYFKLILPFLFMILSFKASLFMILKTTIIYFILSITLFGVSISINISSNLNYFFIFIIYTIINIILYLFFKRKTFNINYNIEYIFCGKRYKLNAYYDTGCNILYKGLPVIVINTKYSFDIYSDELIYITTGNNEISKPVYIINELKIEGSIYKCYCIFLDIEYDAIIGVNLVGL